MVLIVTDWYTPDKGDEWHVKKCVKSNAGNGLETDACIRALNQHMV